MSFQQEAQSKGRPFPSPQERLLKKNSTHDLFPCITHPLHYLRDTHVTMLLRKISPSACSVLDIQSTSINPPISHHVSIMFLWKWRHECYWCYHLSAPSLSLSDPKTPGLLFLQSLIIIYHIVEKMYVCMHDPALIQIFLYNPMMMQHPACNHLIKQISKNQ